MRHRSLISAVSAVFAVALMALPAGAIELRTSPVAVVELFTSQGCSNCPPADAMLERMSKRADVVTLAYHVDYWDYMGWPDSFGSEAWSNLQRQYAKSWGNARIYTPQVVVNGKDGMVGSREQDVNAALSGSQLRLPIELTAKDGVLEVSIEGRAGLPDAVVWLITYRNRADVAIERGENRGKMITYVQIVTGRQVQGMWDSAGGAYFKLPLSEVLSGPSDGAAILVQEEHGGIPGEIIGAAALQM